MQLRTAGFASLWYVVISVWDTSAISAFPIQVPGENLLSTHQKLLSQT